MGRVDWSFPLFPKVWAVGIDTATSAPGDVYKVEVVVRGRCYFAGQFCLRFSMQFFENFFVIILSSSTSISYMSVSSMHRRERVFYPQNISQLLKHIPAWHTHNIQHIRVHSFWQIDIDIDVDVYQHLPIHMHTVCNSLWLLAPNGQECSYIQHAAIWPLHPYMAIHYWSVRIGLDMLPIVASNPMLQYSTSLPLFLLYLYLFVFLFISLSLSLSLS